MKKGFSGFWRGKGFYLALTLVIAGAATASFFAVNSMMTHFGTGSTQSRIDGEETTPWDAQSAQQAEKKQEDVPVSSSSSSASQSGASSQASSPASSAAPSDAASAPASPSPSYVWPVDGEVTQGFSGDELVYNETMGDWRTHNGIDVVSKFGGAVFSPGAGEVKLAQTDDALWGGVVGDDGPEALAMGSETPAGMAHTALQQYLKDLSGAGVLLNVCSKNEDDAARAGLRQPAATLREEDFVCFCANWQPKDANLAAMAKQLNLLPESFVFLDDNPAERALVRQSLPGVAVPELAGPESYVRTLDRAGYFEAVDLSADDKKRAQMYRENALRSAASTSFSNYGEYLRSLAMRAEIGPFRPGQLGRITQLINKTNQFNLTTRRYTEAEVDACMQDAGCITLAGRLEDKFGDNGLVSALIGRVQGSAVHIELWVMSCRVFKREFELAMFDALVAACRARGVHTIVGAYLPTAKNAPVKGLYPSLGFAAAGETPQRAEYRYDIPAAYAPQCRCIAVNNTTPPKEETP